MKNLLLIITLFVSVNFCNSQTGKSVKQILQENENTTNQESSVKSYLERFEAKSDYDAAFSKMVDDITDRESKNTFQGSKKNNSYLTGYISELVPVDLKEVKNQRKKSEVIKIGLKVFLIVLFIVSIGFVIMRLEGRNR
ncbi:hypothetical protein [Algibacter sp. L4_22]|uniref:hypothetical protein n=1 Tax=Algibacter sp. L4_22 TaxID=2942477 RepID=UPI00201B8397|nr:hypothetical protein [Algibacter sp. L4_22]MCL5127120.1 hypothetical protein [Algibacter sp. L4_22]